MFSPMAVIYPQAEVPMLQLAIRKDYDPQIHLALSRAIKSLRREGVLILGSGLSYHNLRMFGPNEQARKASREFGDWLDQAVVKGGSELSRWESAPFARAAHPREDHLVPLFVALGATENEPVTRVYHENDFMGAITVSSYRFG